MTDKPAESAVERYFALEWVPDGEMGFDPGGREVKAAADDAIAALEAKLAAAEEIAAGQRQAYIDTKIALAEAERFINRFIIHDGEAKPYSVREGQVMLEQAEDLNRRAADLLRDACLRYNGPQDDGLHRAVGKWLDDYDRKQEP